MTREQRALLQQQAPEVYAALLQLEDQGERLDRSLAKLERNDRWLRGLTLVVLGIWLALAIAVRFTQPG